jgi:hypothetical protein
MVSEAAGKRIFDFGINDNGRTISHLVAGLTVCSEDR